MLVEKSSPTLFFPQIISQGAESLAGGHTRRFPRTGWGCGFLSPVQSLYFTQPLVTTSFFIGWISCWMREHGKLSFKENEFKNGLKCFFWYVMYIHIYIVLITYRIHTLFCIYICIYFQNHKDLNSLSLQQNKLKNTDNWLKLLLLSACRTRVSINGYHLITHDEWSWQ